MTIRQCNRYKTRETGKVRVLAGHRRRSSGRLFFDWANVFCENPKKNAPQLREAARFISQSLLGDMCAFTVYAHFVRYFNSDESSSGKKYERRRWPIDSNIFHNTMKFQLSICYYTCVMRYLACSLYISSFPTITIYVVVKYVLFKIV